MDDDPHSSNADDKPPKEQFRSQQSLGLITQRFMSLRQKNEVMNLNDVAKELNISKRRVYDVINVLEGLGYVTKAEKNNIKWIGDEHQDEHQEYLEASCEKLRQQERILEMMIKDAHCQLKLHFEDPISRPYLYIPKNDLRTTCSPESKSIIVKSDLDSNAKFEPHFQVQVSEPADIDAPFEMIVRNKGGVKSHALLFTNEGFVTAPESPVKREILEHEVKVENLLRMDERKPDELTLASISKEQRGEEGDDDDEDMDDLETFVLPTSIASSMPYVPETPGRGIFLSPFRNLIDPTCVLPSFHDDYVHIESPQNDAREPASIMEVFQD